ncbi:coth protein-domain-containing protein [Syncephalastrum racemosum]|uniref:Coth protein-domain-containing protein n=1 Tax=Syncephalastrum racemosum TaxID=13706 RepID=A0A1X2HGL3_SYNRA|nr:coth protein-domain-containing protein [Syncephalastrum racemosum]
MRARALPREDCCLRASRNKAYGDDTVRGRFRLATLSGMFASFGSIEWDKEKRGSAPEGVSYRYVLVKQGTVQVVDEEPFTRTNLKEVGLNQFYGRPWTRKEDVRTFEPIAPARYDRVASNLHPQDQIPTLHIIGDQNDIDTLHKNYLQDIDTHVNVTYISADQVLSFSDAKFKLGGRTSRMQNKASYNLNLAKHTKLEGFRKLKIRAMPEDPSYLREKLAFDMLQAAGNPATQASYIRLFINRRAIGLFLLEEKYDKTWLRAEFNGGQDPYETGMLYRGDGVSPGSDLVYHGQDTQHYAKGYSIKAQRDNVNATDAGLKDLIDFMRYLDNELRKDPNTVSVEEWDKRINLDTFFTSMALEFLHSAGDGYLMDANNWYLYEADVSATPPRFTWLSWDLESVMGSGYNNYQQTVQGDYTSFPGMQVRPLAKLMVSVPALDARFRSVLHSIATRIYDPKVSFPVIDSLVEFIRADVAWDTSLPRMRSGLNHIPLIGGPNLVQNLLNHDALGTLSAQQPLSFDAVRAVDFFARVNSHVDFDMAVQGPTGHSSLYGVKEWIEAKSNNVHSYLEAH